MKQTNSPDPFSQDKSDCDEFDRLVRSALKALVTGQVPSERVWKRIKLLLEKGKSLPRRFRAPWLSLAIQPALALLLVLLGGVGLDTMLVPNDASRSSPAPAPSVTCAEEHPIPARVSVIEQEERDLYLLKTRYRPTARANAKPNNGLPQTSLLDRRAEQSSALRSIEETTFDHGGPSERRGSILIEKGGD